MTRQDLINLLAQYHAGLEAELRLLHQLDEVASRQRDATAARDFPAFDVVSDTRDRLTASLVTMEGDLRAVRHQLTRYQHQARHLAGYPAAIALHQRASDLVAKILHADRESMQSLEAAELARRAALASLQQGGTTLAAYRRVLAPHVHSASLLNRRG